HQRARPRDVRDRRRRLALVGSRAADDAGNAAFVAIHQGRPPPARAPCPPRGSRRAGRSGGMGASQPLGEKELLSLLKRSADDLNARAWIVGGYVRDKLLGRDHLNPDGVVEGGGGVELARASSLARGAA